MASRVKLATSRSGVYRIVLQADGRCYIGSSGNITKRWSVHRRELRNGIHANDKLQRAWNMYGGEAFVFEVIEFTDDHLAVEQRLLDELKPYFNIRESVLDLNGSNNPNWRGGISKPVCPCGKQLLAGHTHCSLCSKLGDRNPFFGKTHSAETKAKIRSHRMGNKPANSKSVLVDGVRYPSATEAARQLGTCVATICFRIKSKYYDYHYVEQAG